MKPRSPAVPAQPFSASSAGPASSELELRRCLDIPDSARRVIVFGETSHWDLSWLYSSEEYYERRVRQILDEVIEALESNPRRVFSIESLFFVKLYWARRPAQRERLSRLINEGRLKLTGTGITTPDTLLPDGEGIVRDYLAGQEWLREHGMSVEPRLAYLPDNFGHSPMLPALLRALGFEQAGVTRIDGMHFVGADYRRKSAFPLPGSSAELLQREHRSLDFIWRAADGSEVLCHWNAFTYFQGDMLGHFGFIRWMGMVFGLPWRGARHVARQVRGFARRLQPLARTPYLFCPIGCDFNGPIDDLVSLLDRFNHQHGEQGLHAVCAGLDDYLDLVSHHRAQLPTLELDPNPYWMGFYASRPLVKHICNRIARKLQTADRLIAIDHVAGERARGDLGHASRRRALREAWDAFIVCNHHDFITGTSPDRVWLAEQQPWLLRTEALADGVLTQLRHTGMAARSPLASAPPRWRLADGMLEVVASHYRLVISAQAGGCIVSWTDVAGRELLSGPANDLTLYRDSGGLWRMGHEFAGGSFQPVARTSERHATLHAGERDGLLEVRVEARLGRRSVTRWLWLSDASPVLRARVVGTVRRRRTVTCRFPTRLDVDALTMDVPGGVVERPGRKHYDPTFWAARSFVHVQDGAAARGLVAFLGGPACVALRSLLFDPAGAAADTETPAERGSALEWVAMRNATRELAYGFLPVLAHPASGTSSEEQTLDYAVWLTPGGGFRALDLPRRARLVLQEQPFTPHEAAPTLAALSEEVVCCDHADVLVTAVKVASRGIGVVVRLASFAAGPLQARLRCAVRPVRAAYLCDARERDLEKLGVAGGIAVVPLRASITSVRLIFD